MAALDPRAISREGPEAVARIIASFQNALTQADRIVQAQGNQIAGLVTALAAEKRRSTAWRLYFSALLRTTTGKVTLRTSVLRKTERYTITIENVEGEALRFETKRMSEDLKTSGKPETGEVPEWDSKPRILMPGEGN